MKERFNEEKDFIESHEFMVNDETFIIEIDISTLKDSNATTEQKWLGIFLKKTETSGPKMSKVSLKVEFPDGNRKELKFKCKDLERKHNWGWPRVFKLVSSFPNNSLNLLCTLTLHSKDKDVVSTKRSRSCGTLVEDELKSFKRRRVGLPTSRDKLFTDFAIESEDGMIIKCHRVFLASHSTVFKAMLESDMKEARDKRLKLKFSGEILHHFVDFLYDTFLKTKIILQHYEDFLHLAEKYDIKHLKLQTEDVLIKNLSTDLMINYYVLGDLYNAENLKEAAKIFIVSNKDCFKDKEFTKQLQKFNPERIVDIMNIVM